MCSLTLSVDAAPLVEGGNGQKLLKGIKSRAHYAKTHLAGLMDAPNTYLHAPFPADLRNAGVRKVRINRHRVYFTGTHSDCNYTVFYIKENKKADDWANNDRNPKYQAALREALAGERVRFFREPTEGEPNDGLVEVN